KEFICSNASYNRESSGCYSTGTESGALRLF
uniref:Variable lymphocyte receptor B cassette n=1 Tax=Strongyloides stercoralis TaxID=6248 RepID=A0A0K0EH82_STRER